MIPYFDNGIYNTTSNGNVTLNEFIKSIQRPSDDVLSTLEKVRQASADGNDFMKAKYKARLPYYTPAVMLKKRNYESIISFTGLMPLDFDKLTEKQAVALKYELMKYDYVICSWLSSSRRGVRALVSIPKCKSVEEYKARFGALAKIMSKYPGFDYACKNAVLPLYYSFDDALLYNDDYTTFTNKCADSIKHSRVQHA